ncbi:MAG: UDP-N-acetylglucosamine 2-epimerase [Parcubacteria group bacterium GW2011_GWB1_44_7]|nr:MAG: UDP-N-acetylglucosamine 2-epimerase [Parcubacteria group bacterium GW2011_GWB1_44_7]
MTNTKRQKRKICFVITNFIHYSRGLFILEELKNRSDVELHIVISGTALLAKYSSKFAYVKNILEREGYKNLHELYFNLEGDSHLTKAKTAGIGVIEFSTFFHHLKPDIVVLRGDRFEVLSAAVSAAYLQIPIAHIEGGDVTGSIDESVRHAITKLSHLHFATNEDARKRILRLGENPKYVFNFGSPEIEVVQRIINGNHHVDFSQTGSGAPFDIKQDFLMVMYQPVTSETERLAEYTKTILAAVHETALPALWFWPNFDTGAEEISHTLRIFRDQVKKHKIRFMRYLPPRDFIWLLRHARALIGNSSAGIKESSYLGVPVVNIGRRQATRLRAKNVLDVPHKKEYIRKAIEKQIKKNRYQPSKLYFANDTAKKIAQTLAKANLYVQKKFYN